MSGTSLFYYNADLQKSQPRNLKLLFKITAAKTVVDMTGAGQAFLPAFDALASQAVIDDFLKTTSEFALAAFDSTSLGADAFGVLVNMEGQCAKVLAMSAKCYSGTGGATRVERFVEASAALTASTLASEIAKGANGNIGLKVDFGNTPDFDALTSGFIQIDIQWVAK